MGRGLLLLVAAALSPVVALPPCFTNGTDGGLDIRGRWEEAPELLSAPGAASALRCRVEGAGARACMDHKASKKGAPVAEAGGRARRFVPETCELDPRVGVARARGLADAIGPHRTVFLLGDSLLMQHKSTLRCELESAGMLVNASGAMVGRAMVMHNSARVAFYRVSHLEHLKRQLYALANDPGASYPCSPPLSSRLSQCSAHSCGRCVTRVEPQHPSHQLCVDAIPKKNHSGGRRVCSAERRLGCCRRGGHRPGAAHGRVCIQHWRALQRAEAVPARAPRLLRSRVPAETLPAVPGAHGFPVVGVSRGAVQLICTECLRSGRSPASPAAVGWALWWITSTKTKATCGMTISTEVGATHREETPGAYLAQLQLAASVPTRKRCQRTVVCCVRGDGFALDG